jgi:hypothetical protein
LSEEEEDIKVPEERNCHPEGSTKQIIDDLGSVPKPFSDSLTYIDRKTLAYGSVLFDIFRNYEYNDSDRYAHKHIQSTRSFKLSEEGNLKLPIEIKEEAECIDGKKEEVDRDEQVRAKKHMYLGRSLGESFVRRCEGIYGSYGPLAAERCFHLNGQLPPQWQNFSGFHFHETHLKLQIGEDDDDEDDEDDDIEDDDDDDDKQEEQEEQEKEQEKEEVKVFHGCGEDHTANLKSTQVIEEDATPTQRYDASNSIELSPATVEDGLPDVIPDTRSIPSSEQLSDSFVYMDRRESLYTFCRMWLSSNCSGFVDRHLHQWFEPHESIKRHASLDQEEKEKADAECQDNVTENDVNNVGEEMDGAKFAQQEFARSPTFYLIHESKESAQPKQTLDDLNHYNETPKEGESPPQQGHNSIQLSEENNIAFEPFEFNMCMYGDFDPCYLNIALVEEVGNYNASKEAALWLEWFKSIAPVAGLLIVFLAMLFIVTCKVSSLVQKVEVAMKRRKSNDNIREIT